MLGRPETPEERLQGRAAPGQRRLLQAMAIGVHQTIEQDECGRAFGGQLAHPALRRMQAHLQGLKREFAIHRNGQFAVQDEVVRRQRQEGGGDVWKIPGERLSRLGPQVDFVIDAKGQAAEAIPLGFETPAGIGGQVRDQPCLHGREGAWQGQAGELRHRRVNPRGGPAFPSGSLAVSLPSGAQTPSVKAWRQQQARPQRSEKQAP